VGHQLISAAEPRERAMSIFRTASRMRWLILGALLPAALLPALEARAAQFPNYKVAACCQLCPAASDPARYDTKFLDSFKTLVQGSDGWVFRSEADLLMNFGMEPDGVRRMAAFRNALAQRGTELVVVVQPPRGLMHADKLRKSGHPYDPAQARASYVRYLSDLRSAGVTVPPLERLVDERNAAEYFSRVDHHWTPEGTRRTAQVVAEQITRMPQYAALPRKRFETRREGLLVRNATLSRAVQTLCGYGAPKLYLPRFVTEPAGDAGGDLFGDDALPQVTLIGTSNSEAAFNFSGYLSEYLQADVLNASVIGGGMEAAMLSYLMSEEFKSNPPKLIVWELQHFHNLGDSMFHRQALPMMNDGCNGKPAILDREVTLRIGNNEVLFNGGGAVRNLRGRDHLLDIQFSDPNTLLLRGQVWYTTGNKDTMRVEHSARAASLKGRFIVALREDGAYADQTFLGLDLELEPPEVEPGAPPPKPTGPLRARARLCSKSAMPLSASAAAAGKGATR
jgi:alginate biosynthesis protein AlgX